MRAVRNGAAVRQLFVRPQAGAEEKIALYRVPKPQVGDPARRGDPLLMVQMDVVSRDVVEVILR